MNKVIRSNSWYGDCTLEGDDITLYRDSHIEINGSVRVELPISSFGKENILQLVAIRWKGQILIAGQGQVGDKGSGNWFYKDGKWKLISTSFGTFACAFASNYLYLVVGNNLYCILDLESNLISDPIQRQIGSNGIRYIDFNQSPDGIVTGDSTYGPGLYNLSQYTIQTGIVVGQSYIDGCIAFCNDIRYKLESGDTQFIRFHRKGNNLAIAIVKMLDKETVYYWMTVDDLKNFPVEGKKQEGPIYIGDDGPKDTKEYKMSKNKDQVRDDINELIRFYNDPDGLNRKARGLPTPVVFNDPAITDWFTQAVMDDINVVKNRIKQFPEYKDQHKTENPQ